MSLWFIYMLASQSGIDLFRSSFWSASFVRKHKTYRVENLQCIYRQVDEGSGQIRGGKHARRFRVDSVVM